MISSRLSRVLPNALALLAAAAAAVALPLSPGRAADYPARPVRVIVPFAAGGATDVLARTINAKLSDRFGKQFYVENKVGAGGAIGAKEVASAAPDGHVLLVYHVGLVASALLQRPRPYDPVSDFTPLGLLATSPNLVTVGPKLPVKDLADLIAQGRAKKGELTYGSSGFGGSDHLAMLRLQELTGASFTHVPFRGSAPAIQGGIVGDVQVVLASAGSVAAQAQAGLLRPLAVTGARRMSILPDVPTTAEAGFPDFDQSIWFGIWGPPGMPAELVATLDVALREVLALPDVRAAFDKVGLDVEHRGPASFAKLVRDENTLWRDVLAKADLLPK